MYSTPPVARGSASEDVPDFANGGIANKFCHFGHPNRNEENVQTDLTKALSGRASNKRAFKLTSDVLAQPDGSSTLKVDIDGHSPPKGQVNSWTTVYDEGWRIEAHDPAGMTSYFALSAYECVDGNDHCGKNGDNEDHEAKTVGYRSLCGKTLSGWYSAPEGMGCFHAEKNAGDERDHTHAYVLSSFIEHPKRSMIEVHSVYHEGDFSFALPQYEEVLKLHEKQEKDRVTHRVHRGSVIKDYASGSGKPGRMMNVVDQCTANDMAQDSLIAQYEKKDPVYDWRDKFSGKWNTPVEDQGACGSCYAVAAKYSLEARANIALLKGMEQKAPAQFASLIQSNSTNTASVFSAHSVLACSYYNQGCQGGFPYAVAQHARDFGIPTEACMPYGSAGNGVVQECPVKCFQDQSNVLFAKDFKYAQGFYGSCGQARIMKDLRENGPIAVAIEVSREIRAAGESVPAGQSFLQVNPHAEKTPNEHHKLAHNPGVSLLEARWGMKSDSECNSKKSHEDVTAGMKGLLGDAYVDVADKQFAIYLNEVPQEEKGSLYTQTRKQLSEVNGVSPECIHLELVAGSLNSWEYTDHAIVVVGWGQQKLEDGRDSKYWIIRNSWGDSYGDDGYAYVVRGVNYAGIESQAVLLTPDPERGWLQAKLKEFKKPLLRQGAELTDAASTPTEVKQAGIRGITSDVVTPSSLSEW